MKKERILITGAGGQIGTVLTQALRETYGAHAVIASDIKRIDHNAGPFVVLDILNRHRLEEIIDDYKITQIYHLAAILSANGEWNPLKTWDVNLNAWIMMLEVCRLKGIRKIFYPSTIAVFGATTPKEYTPQHTSLEPTTVYGISKQTGELWANYYVQKYQMDIRSVRYPGIIGYQSMPQGGTTDYAVEIFHSALKDQHYTCYLSRNKHLPMLYMPDAIRATLELMEAPESSLSVRTSYNLAGISFSPEEIFNEIKKSIPDFTIEYKPDFRDEIASSWSHSIDDSCAREDWGWKLEYDLSKITLDMLEKLSQINT